MTQGGTKVPAPCAPSRTQQLGYILQYDNDEPRCYSAIATLQCIGNSHSFWSSSATAPLPAPLQGRRPPCVPGPRTRWHTRGLRNHGLAALCTPMHNGLKGRVRGDVYRQLTAPRPQPRGQQQQWGCRLFRPHGLRALNIHKESPPVC